MIRGGHPAESGCDSVADQVEITVVRREPARPELAASARWQYLLSLKACPRTVAALDLALEQGTITLLDVPGYVQRGRGGQLNTFHWLVHDGKLDDNETVWQEIRLRTRKAVNEITPPTPVAVMADGTIRKLIRIGKIDFEMRPAGTAMATAFSAPDESAAVAREPDKGAVGRHLVKDAGRPLRGRDR